MTKVIVIATIILTYVLMGFIMYNNDKKLDYISNNMITQEQWEEGLIINIE